MNYVNLVSVFFESIGNDSVVQSNGTHCAQKLIRQAQLSSGQCRVNPYFISQWPDDGPWKDQEFRPRSRQAIDLLPSRITNPGCAQLVGKTVQNPDTSFWHLDVSHRVRSLFFEYSELMFYAERFNSLQKSCSGKRTKRSSVPKRISIIALTKKQTTPHD
jgi:hypothetical protein